MDFTALQIFFCVLCTLYVPSKPLTADDKFIITTGENSIYLYKGDVTSLFESPFQIKGIFFTTHIEMDVANDTIFALDLHSTCVLSLTGFTSSAPFLNKMHCGISKSLSSAIAYDWVTSNMYWSDALLKWIALRPMYTTDTQLYRIIIQEVTDISALAVDPNSRYIFWIGNSTSGGRIERASLAGQQRKAILIGGLVNVRDIVADVISKRLFWVDSFRFSIDSIDYEGLQRKQLFKRLDYILNALAVDKENICTVLEPLKKWICLAKHSGYAKHVSSEESRTPWGIAIFNKAIQPQDKSNFCASASCQHFCVNGDDRDICMCKEGYNLNQDGKTCSATHGLFGKGILVSYKTQICILDYRSIIHGHADDFNCTHTGLQGLEYLEVNAAEHVIFYYDSANKRIKSYDVRSGMSKTIQSSTGIVSGLSFDWNQKMLYWCESNTGIIGRVSLRNDIIDLFLDSDNDVNDVSVDPHNRTVYWIEGNTTILGSKMEDGKNRNIIVKAGRNSGLFFDIKSSRLFWIQDSSISSIKSDGSDIQYYKSASSSNQLIMFKSYLIWIIDKRTLGTLPITSESVIVIRTSITLPNDDIITGIAVFDEDSQPLEKGACDVNNGGCDHICIAVIDGRVCRCQFGFTLDSDGKSCETVPLERDFLLATDYSHSRIYQVSLNSGDIRTLDIPLVEQPRAVRYNSRSKYLYWCELGEIGKIKRARMDGKDWSIIYSTDTGTYPETIELDQSSGYLYFITSALSHNGYVGVINTHNLYSKILLSGLKGKSYGLALYPSKGYTKNINDFVRLLFFTNFDGDANYMYRSTMDGSLKIIIHKTQLMLYDVTIDYNADRLYWSEYYELWSSDLFGLKREKLVAPESEITCIVLAYPHIYYYDSDYTKIIKMNVIKKLPVSWMSDRPEMGILLSLDIYPKAAMPVNPLCAKQNGMCSTFCLPKEKSTVCGCNEGTALLGDGKTCEGVTQCSEQVQFGSLEVVCQRYTGESCGFSCESDYIPKVQPQTVTCQENGTWNHDLSDLCSAESITTNYAVVAGGAVAGAVAIAIGVIGVTLLFRRKKSASAQRGVGQPQVYYSSQSVNPPCARQQFPPSSVESRLSLGNAYSNSVQEDIQAPAVENPIYSLKSASTKHTKSLI